jgi:hypothetical protein
VSTLFSLQLPLGLALFGVLVDAMEPPPQLVSADEAFGGITIKFVSGCDIFKVKPWCCCTPATSNNEL